MKAQAIFYHAGCPVCIEAEKNIIHALDPSKYNIEIKSLNNNKSYIEEAESAQVKSVPALVLDGMVFHINFGASLTDVKGDA